MSGKSYKEKTRNCLMEEQLWRPHDFPLSIQFFVQVWEEHRPWWAASQGPWTSCNKNANLQWFRAFSLLHWNWICMCLPKSGRFLEVIATSLLKKHFTLKMHLLESRPYAKFCLMQTGGGENMLVYLSVWDSGGYISLAQEIKIDFKPHWTPYSFFYLKPVSCLLHPL